jgi:flavin-dependent dehydrogenase
MLPRQQLSIATGFFAHGVTSREIVLETVANPSGYIWSFPRADHLAIGICAQAVDGTRSGQLLDRAAAWIERSRIAPTATLQPYSWPIPTLDAQTLATQSVAGNGWCLVGDAAGLVDPITREGIYFALQSASYAAEAIAAKGPAAASAYSSRLREDIVPELTKAAQLKAGFFRMAFTDLMLEALRDSARIRRVMAELIAGAQPYRSLERRLVRTLEFGLAWRALKVVREGRAGS